MSTSKSEMRRQLLLLVASVLALDVVAYVAREAFDVDARGRDANVWFTGAWMVATLLVVLPRLRRIRAVRDAARRERLRRP
jgi:hypothetical protein